jgi:hypothetical protein
LGVQWDVLAARRERQARRAPAGSVEVRPPELVVRDEAVAGGGRGLRLLRHGFRLQSKIDFSPIERLEVVHRIAR